MTSSASPSLAQRVCALLPQTQCGACGHPGCDPFAAAVVAGASPPDACTPGGAAVAQRIAAEIGQAFAPSLAECLAPLPAPAIARIREADCIGCTKCIDACPTDAIVGAPRQLHGILAADCTGCGLCLPPCPVDCIELTPHVPPVWPSADATAGRRIAAGTPLEACTQCGLCGGQCPSALAPRELALAVRHLDAEAATGLGLSRCTECRACDAVCPVGIPLTDHFIHGKALVTALAHLSAGAAHALERQEASQQRRARAPVAAAVALVAPPADHHQAHAGVMEALARARARRAS